MQGAGHYQGQGLHGGQSQQQQQGAHRHLTYQVTGAANNGGGLIRITTPGNPRFHTGDRITITGVGGTVEANAGWNITVISPTTFDLIGSTFTNAYTSGGQAARP